MRFTTKIALAGVSLLAMPNVVFAQSAPADESNAPSNEDIVVTGTLIRGTQATGSQTLTVDAKAITAIGATSTNELLTSIPQLASFNGRPEGNPRGLTAVASIVRPNLRGFPSTNQSSGALTLIMVDGARIAPVGSNASSVDPDVIPATILEGVDIVTDGGSSLYGADAVSGVMNFRTMKKFDGVKLDGNFGFGDRIKGFHQWDGSVTAGTSWSTGNFYISGGHAERDAVINSQTPWANGTVYNAAGVASVTSTTCNTPQSTVSRFVYIPSFGVWTNNPLAAGAGPVSLGTGCDQQLAGTYLPSLTRSNVFASLTNTFSDTVSLRVTGYWLKRELGLPGYPLGYTSKSLTPVAPRGAPGTAGAPASSPFDFPQGVGFALGPNASYVNVPQKITDETWGISPELTVKLGSNWQVRSNMHFGRSHSATHFPGLNGDQIDAYVTGGQIVPTNIAAASSSVIADITNWETAQDTTHQLFMFKSVADGKIFSLPGGDAKLAVGVEYQNNKDATRINTGKLGVLGTLPYTSFSRDVESVFGELHLPVTSFADLAGSVRYDHYSDFGDTVNPNIGVTLKPTSWLKVFGHWGTSYNAPTPYDDIGVGLGRTGQNYTATVRPQVAVGKTDNKQGSYFIVLTGVSPSNPPKPQTSSSWAIGFDATPIAGFNVGAEFYSIDLNNSLGTVNVANSSAYLTNPELFIYNSELTANGNALYNQILGQLVNGAAVNTQVGGSATVSGAANVAILVDTRISNVNNAKVQGIDFHLNYQTDTSIGQVAFTNSGTLQTRSLQTNSGATTNELGHGSPRFSWASAIALRNGGFSTKVTVNFTGKYHDSAVDNLGVEEGIKAFVVTNLNLGYDFGETSGPLDGTSLRLTVDNLFNVSPTPVKRLNTNNPTFNNWTLGRVIKLGFTKKF